MSDQIDLDKLTADFIECTENYSGGPPEADYIDAINRFYAYKGFNHAEKRAFIASLMPKVHSDLGKGFLTVLLGSSVEQGGVPDPEIPLLLSELFTMLSKMPGDDEDEDQDEDQDEEDAGDIDDERAEALAKGVELMCQGLVAHLSRSQQALEQLKNNEESVKQLLRHEYSATGPMWLLELLRKSSGRLLLIHGEEAAGVIVEFKNISTCFHLFSLIQVCLEDKFPGAKTVAPNIPEIAFGGHGSHASDSAWWHYGMGQSPEANVMASVWGEQSPDDLYEIDEHKVIILWPPQVGGRLWDTSFFGPFLEPAKPDMKIVSTLNSEELKQWRAKLKLPAIY